MSRRWSPALLAVGGLLALLLAVVAGDLFLPGGEGVLIAATAGERDRIDTVVGTLMHCPGCDIEPGQPIS